MLRHSDPQYEVCPKCHTLQKKGRTRCWGCVDLDRRKDAEQKDDVSRRPLPRDPWKGL